MDTKSIIKESQKAIQALENLKKEIKDKTQTSSKTRGRKPSNNKKEEKIALEESPVEDTKSKWGLPNISILINESTPENIEFQELVNNYKKLLIESKEEDFQNKHIKSVIALSRNFLRENRNAKIKAGLMPDVIESQADIEMLNVYLRPNEISFEKSNKIQIDIGDKTKNQALKKAFEECREEIETRLVTPTITPATFLKRIAGISKILEEENKTKKSGTSSTAKLERTEAKIKITSYICMAYLEILEEGAEEPLENADNKTTRKSKTGGDEIAGFKKMLLDQSQEEEPPSQTPIVTDEEIREIVSRECREGITTGDAVQLSCIFAERKIESFKLNKKRETLFKMRSHIASKFFEEIKKLRNSKDCINDRLLPQKPRYKTPCVLVIRHPIHERCEVVTINPQSNISYWGNPEAEKKEYALAIRDEETKISLIQTMDKAAEQISKYQTPIVIIISVLIAISLFLYTITKKQEENNKAQATPQTTEQQIEKPSEINKWQTQNDGREGNITQNPIPIQEKNQVSVEAQKVQSKINDVNPIQAIKAIPYTFPNLNQKMSPHPIRPKKPTSVDWSN